MGNQIIILVCSFLDEWNQHLISNKIPEYSKDINDLKNILKPVFSRINKRSGLKEYRNTILAHNFRNKGFPILNEDVISLNIPITHEEFLGITQLLNIVVVEVMDKFSNIISYDDFASLTSNFPEITVKQNGSKVDIEEILSEVIRLKNIN